MTVLLALVHATALHTSPRTPGVDSVVIERLGASRPRYFPLTKRNAITASDRITDAVSQLQAAHFFELDSASLAQACGGPAATTVNRLAITVYSDAGTRQLVIADDCLPDLPDRAATVADLRALVWQLFRPNARRPGR